MNTNRPQIPQLFINRFEVDYRAPFRRYLNRLEVEIGREDYRHLKRIELLEEVPPETVFSNMEEITERLLKTTQNNYNRELLMRLKAKVYLDVSRYDVYYRLSDRCLRFVPTWRQRVLRRFFSDLPVDDTGWRPCDKVLAGFEARFLPDRAGGALMLRRSQPPTQRLPLLTSTHGPYDPHTLEVALYFLRHGKGEAGLINLGFSGREPLADENLEKLKDYGVPLNPSNIDVIYPYTDESGHPFCYKMEENLRHHVALLEMGPPETIIDIHGCVGTLPDDDRLVVGLGGFPPYEEPEGLGKVEDRGNVLHLSPHPPLRQGLALLRDLSDEFFVQFCADTHRCYHFVVLGGLQLLGRHLDPRREVESLLPGEERTFLPVENVRWLPGAGGNALQRMEARKMRRDVLCLHVEIPTRVRRKVALKLREEEIGISLDASSL